MLPRNPLAAAGRTHRSTSAIGRSARSAKSTSRVLQSADGPGYRLCARPVLRAISVIGLCGWLFMTSPGTAMRQAILVSAAILAYVLLTQYGRRRLSCRTWLSAIIGIPIASAVYLARAPGHLDDIYLYLASAAVGIGFGALASAATGVERDQETGQLYGSRFAVIAVRARQLPIRPGPKAPTGRSAPWPARRRVEGGRGPGRRSGCSMGDRGGNGRRSLWMLA